MKANLQINRFSKIVCTVSLYFDKEANGQMMTWA